MMASLQRSRGSTGDFTITCQGQELRAHLLVLSHGLVPPPAPTLATASGCVEKDQNSVDIKVWGMRGFGTATI